MSVRDTLLRNTFWYALVTVIGLAVGIVMSVVLARGLGPARMGDYSYVLWAGRTLMAIATLGFALATVRYTASALAQGQASLALGFIELFRRRQLVATTLVVIVAVPLVLAAAPVDLRWALVIVVVGLFPLTLEHIYSHAVYGAQRYEFTTQASTIKMLLQLSAAVLVLSLGGDILSLVIANTLTTILACEIQRARVRRLYPATAAEVPPAAHPELRAYLVPLSVVVVLDALVWDRCEVFFLRLWASSHDIAFYSLAFGLATKAMVLPEAAVGALLPTFSALHGGGGNPEFRAVYRSALRYVTVAAVAIAAISIPVAPGLVRLLYGAEYATVAPLFVLLVLVAILSAQRRVVWAALRGLGDRRCAVTATSVAAVVNVGAAIILIPPMGVWGAAAANSLAQAVATVWALIVMGTTHRCGFPFLDVARIAASGLVAFATTTALIGDDAGFVTLVVAASGGSIVFLLGCVLLRIIGPREWHHLVSTARRISGRTAAPAQATSTMDASGMPHGVPALERRQP